MPLNVASQLTNWQRTTRADGLRRALVGLNRLRMRQVFGSHFALAGAFGVRSNPLGDALRHVLSKAGAPSAAFLQTPVGAFIATTLQDGKNFCRTRSTPSRSHRL
jgi:hypothetical protein